MAKKFSIKSFLLSVTALASVAAVSIAGTVAYLQDTDSDVNVMTLGNVFIEQHEYERVVDENGAWVSTGETDKYGYTPDKLQEFSQAKPLMPAYFADGEIKWDDRANSTHQQSWGQIGASGANQLFDDSVKNAQDKFVFVENTGESDAYVRTWIALEQGEVAAADFKSVIMTNMDKDHWDVETVATDVVIDDSEYYVLCATYLGAKSNPTGILEAGKTSYPSLLQVYMRPEATNEDVAAIDGNENGTYDILVFSQAVQAKGFADAETALNEAFGTDHPWGDKAPFASAADAAEMDEALKDGATTLVLGSGEFVIPDSAKGKNLTVIGGEDTNVAVQVESGEGCDYAFDGSTVVFENITFNTNSTTYTGFARMKAIYNNCTFNGTYTTYDDSVFNNCTFNVTGNVYNLWTWGAPNVTINNSTFNSDGKAVLLYGPANTNLTVNNCTFNDKGGLTDLKAAIEIGNDYDKSYTLTVNNTTVNGYEINDTGISTGTTLWANKNSMPQTKLNVVVDGVDVY